MNLLFWTKEAKADRLMTKLENLYTSISDQQLSSIPEIAELQKEANQIELTKIANAHYLLRKEHPHLDHDRLPLSPGIVINKLTSFDSSFPEYAPKFKPSPSHALFFSRALAHANVVHAANRLSFISSELYHTYTHTDALVIYDYLIAKQPTEFYYKGSSLTNSDLEPFAIHFKVDIITTF